MWNPQAPGGSPTLRSGFRALVWLLLVAFHLAATQAAGQERGGLTQFVCLNTDHQAVVVEPVAVASSVGSLRDLIGDREITHCWAWNEVCPPRRVTIDDDPFADCGQPRRLEVRVAGSEGEPRHVDIAAAPVEMWREVPGSLLPTTTMDLSAFSVPHGEGAWRLQARTVDLATTWQDALPDETSAVLTLRPASDFRFAVTADNAPLADARLYLVRPRRDAPGEVLGFEPSDDEGLVTVTLPTEETVAAMVTHDTRAAEPFPSLRNTPPVIELGRGLAVIGQAVNEEGDPVPGVRLRGMSFARNGFGLVQRHRGRTGVDGRFAITGFSRGQASLQTEEGGDLTFSRTFDLEQSVSLGTIVLRPSEFAWVQVVDSRDGSALPHARVRNASGYWTSVAEDGLARLALDFGRSVSVAAKGYVRTQLHLPMRAGSTKVEALIVDLRPAFSIEGVFVSADGVTPAAGGTVTALNRSRGGSGMARSIAPDGSFAFDLHAGRYELTFTAGNSGFLRMELAGAAGESRDLGIVSAPPSAWAWGYVLAQDDYTPVSGASVSWTRPSRFGPILAPVMGLVTTAMTDGEGYFEIHGLEAGASRLRVQADGFAPRDVPVEVPAMEGIDVGVVELSRGRLVVVRSDVGEGVVVLDAGRTGLPWDRLRDRLVEGTAEFSAVPEEPFGVLVHEGGDPVCEKQVDDSVGDQVVTCNYRAARVTGLVTRGGHPGGGALVWRRLSETQLPEGIMHHRSGPFTTTEDVESTQSLELRAPLASDGRYSLRAVLPGEWEVIWMPLDGGAQDVRSVTVPNARDAVLDFRYDGVSIEGLVLDPERQPVPLASVTVFPSRRTVGTARDGRFEVLGLRPGTHQLRARQRHLRSSLVAVELRDRERRELVELVLKHDPGADELEIVLRGGGDGFCFVEMDGSPRKIVRIDAGVASVTPEPPLPDGVRVACQTEGRWILDGRRNLQEALNRSIEFYPSESTSSIRLVGAASAEQAQIIGPGGWDLGRLRLWLDGASGFAVGETIPNLPAGEYTVNWKGRTHTLRTRSHRVVEVEVDSL